MAREDATASAVPGSGRPAERCLSGSLTSITVTELLHFLALHRKSGKLSLRRRQGSGLIVLRKGRIIYAASSSVREAFGNILVCRGLITEAILTDALERQQWAGENRRLGTVLIDMGAVREEQVSEVVHYQVASVLAEVDKWHEGFFRFDAMDIPEGDEIEVDAQDFVVTEGLNTEQVLLQVATKLDENDAAALEEAPPTESSETRPSMVASLPGIVEQLPSLVLHGELSHLIMRRASGLLHRGILFIVREDAAVGIGHFGLPPQGAQGLEPDFLRQPLTEPSVLSDVVQHQEPYRGPLPATQGNQPLIRILGGASPPEVLVLPVLVGGTVELVFYGDNAPQNEPIGPFRSLELVLAEAGLQIEQEMLDARAKTLEKARRSLGD